MSDKQTEAFNLSDAIVNEFLKIMSKDKTVSRVLLRTLKESHSSGKFGKEKELREALSIATEEGEKNED